MADREATQGTTRVVLGDVEPLQSPKFYANVINVNYTPWDFALHFYNLVLPVRLEPRESEADVRPDKIASVTIPVTLMRGFIEALQTALNQYEDAYGRIEIPKRTPPDGKTK